MTGQSVPWQTWRICVTDQIGRQRAVASLLCRCELVHTYCLPPVLLGPEDLCCQTFHAPQGFAKSLLDVADNLERAFEVAGEDAKQIESLEPEKAKSLLRSLLDGLQMTDKQLIQAGTCRRSAEFTLFRHSNAHLWAWHRCSSRMGLCGTGL